LTAKKKRTPRASSPKRGKVSRAEKIGRRSAQESREGRVVEESRGRRGTEKRGGMPARPGTLSRDGLHCRYETTTVQKLDKNLFATFISTF